MHPMRSARMRQRHALRRGLRSIDAYAFFDLLTDSSMLDQVESQLPAHRERLLPPTETLAMFLAQALSVDRSCQQAVDAFVVRRVAGGLSSCSTSTGAFCRARQRLPEAMVSSLLRFTGQRLTHLSGDKDRWQGRRVLLVDGTTVPMPDTAANQAAFPQIGQQKPGLGFPLCRLLALLCLSSGAVIDAATCPVKGKGNDEQSLLRTLLDHLQPRDVLLGDALFATYFLLAELKQRGVDGVFEQHGARRRSTDFRRGRRLGPRDHVIELRKPTQRPPWMTPAQYAAAPDTLAVREVLAGGKLLVTTLLCPRQTPKDALKALYRQRWHAELDLRCLKTTLGMETLSCRTPAMAMKELRVYLLAYNLVRSLMLRAAHHVGVAPRQLSFKHTVQLWLAWRAIHRGSDRKLSTLLTLIAQRRVGQRPGRIEPRAVKRRPKPYKLLMQPRPVAREFVRAHGHPVRVK
jgi:Transposase DDE domain